MDALKIALKVVWNLLAAIGLLVVAGAAYLWFVDPLNIRPLLFPSGVAPAGTSPLPQQPAGSAPTPNDPRGNVPLSQQQQSAAASLGLSSAAVADLLTPATEACAVATLGQARVDQIKQGAAPTAAEMLRAGHCLNR